MSTDIEFDPQLDLVTFEIEFWAKTVDEVESIRKATQNRIRFLIGKYDKDGKPVPDKDGEDRSPRWDPDAEPITTMKATLDSFIDNEKDTARKLERAIRQSPFGPWVGSQVGIAAKGLGRLLGAIGDPYVRRDITREDGSIEPPRPRLVSELWQYCGHGDPARSKRRRGQKVEHSPEAKMRVFVIAEAASKLNGEPDKNGRARARSPYRDVYDKRKANTEGHTHASECVRCGPSGKPALPGSDWSDAHRHADALRIVGKELLKDLWRFSRDVHSGT